MSDTPLLYDWNGVPTPTSAYAPVTARPGAALYNPQGGLLSLGSDYGATPKAQSPKVDASGSQYVVPVNPSGNAAQVYTSQAAPAATSQYGNLMMGRQDLPGPSTFYPLNMDMLNSVNVHHKSKPTFRAIIAGVACAQNKSLLSLVNSGNMVIRVNECSVYVPPQGSGGNLLGLGSATTYIPLICEIRRITSQTKGTSTSTVSACPGDTSDVLDSGVTILSNATIVTTGPAFHRQDAIPGTNSCVPWYVRGDQNEKTFVVRPGEGFSVTCLSSGTIASGNSTTSASVDIEMIFTQTVA